MIAFGAIAARCPIFLVNNIEVVRADYLTPYGFIPVHISKFKV